ncbi:hypothetical protein ABPG75_000843 [Micractinium tetrahymenae]
MLLDPYDALGGDLLVHIFSFLDAPTLLLCSHVSRCWQDCAADDRLWQQLAEMEWADKVYVGPAGQRTDLPWRQRFLLAEADLQRTAITVEELCAFRWTFRFKPQAGIYWLGLTAGLRMERLFSEDGSVSAPPDDALWGEHESRWRFCKTRDGVRGHYVKINHWPSLDCSRTTGGGWRMQNIWVIYEAILPQGGPYSHGLHHGLARHLTG